MLKIMENWQQLSLWRDPPHVHYVHEILGLLWEIEQKDFSWFFNTTLTGLVLLFCFISTLILRVLYNYFRELGKSRLNKRKWNFTALILIPILVCFFPFFKGKNMCTCTDVCTVHPPTHAFFFFKLNWDYSVLGFSFLLYVLCAHRKRILIC